MINQPMMIKPSQRSAIHFAVKIALGLALPIVSFAKPMTQLDSVVITANPLTLKADEITNPTSVLRRDQLQQQTATTLGDVLANEAGISADNFGQGASRPIIRGQTAPRVKVVQNGLTVHDASQISPDHQVSVPVADAKQIEVIKGASTLMYGGGAIGGVINVVDDSIKNQSLQTKLIGEVTFVGQQATDGYYGVAKLSGDITPNLIWSLNLQKTDQGNIQIPHWTTKEIDNSWYTQNNANLGLAYIQEDDGYLGVSVQRLRSEYGLPFHVHNQCQPNDTDSNKLDCSNHHHHTTGSHEHGTPPFVKLSSNIYQILAEKQRPFAGLNVLTGKLGLTDYQHQEIDEDKVSTTFKNKAINAKITAKHDTITHKFGSMTGVIGIDYQNSDFSAKGAEAYLPKTKTKQLGLFWVERISQQEADNRDLENNRLFSLKTLDPHQHQTDTPIDAHEHQQTGMAMPENLKQQKPWYVEFGLRQDWQKIDDIDNRISKSHHSASVSVETGKYISNDSQLSARISHAQRLPSAQELFANGAHLATNAWERGNPNLKKEKTTGIDVTWRYDKGRFNTQLSGFYNHSDNYIYAKTQDLVKSGESAGFRLIDYSQTKAKHYGGEISARYYLNDNISLGGFADLAIIKLDDKNLTKKYAPRLTAPRIGGDITAQFGAFDMVLSGYHRFQQNKIADYETITPSYNMLNAKLVYHNFGKHDYTVFLQINNLLNELAQNHAAYLAEQVPLPERSINAGMTYRF